MRESKKRLLRAKSYSSIYDLLGTRCYSNIMPAQTYRNNTEMSGIDSQYSPIQEKRSSELVNETPYVTSEKYHFLNKDISYGSIFRSTSTIFYDLDELARKQSFTLVIKPSKEANQCKPKSQHGFHQATAIIQECETQMTPKLMPRDSIIINNKKVKRKFLNEVELSSEIFLRDNDYEDFKKKENTKRCFGKEITGQQKFWSYAKYKTEITKLATEEKKAKKKERSKRTEDPCPCQLFSYACPCVDDKKSLTELASKSTEQIASKEFVEEKKNEKIKRRSKNDTIKESKLTNTSFYQQTPFCEPVVHAVKSPEPPQMESRQNVKSNPKPPRKIRRIICPKCHERVEIVSSMDEDISQMRPEGYQNNPITSAAAYTYVQPKESDHQSKSLEGDFCNHDPPCELIPVCQILPEGLPQKNLKKGSKPNPRVIKITKACRHHPPCSVVPSCQRANVLKNNCEFIPPCLHRPRCVNLPLCVPISKTFNLNEFTCNHVETVDNCTTECSHVPRCKYVPECQQDPSDNNSVNQQFNIVPQVQNVCECINQYSYQVPSRPPTGKMSPHTICAQCHVTCPNNFSCKSTKSCQYENTVKDSASDAVIFIRDVGCQFKNKNLLPEDSMIRSMTPSASFELMNVKMGNYYTGMHTLRYEDKFTNPDSSFSPYESFETTTSSEEVLSPKPSRRPKAAPCSSRGTGFPVRQRSSFMAAYATCQGFTDYLLPINQRKNSAIAQPLVVKSKKSLLKSKYRKMFSSIRRKRANSAFRLVSGLSKKNVKCSHHREH